MEDKIMTPEEFKEKMKSIVSGGYYEIRSMSGKRLQYLDSEKTHREMDDVICMLLRSLGYGEGVDIFEDSERWYS